MRINIYYGGRGLIGDPTLYVLKKMTAVFEELNVKLGRYDLFEQKSGITMLPQTFKEADGIILASTVEWHGIGGHMMSFLDACWLYGDKEKISHTYMAPVIMSTTYGEKEAELDLMNAWQTLGGIVCPGLSGYIPEISEIEKNENYQKLIEKSAENIYRSISQQSFSLPVSVMQVRKITYRTKNTSLTQQETEQLSEYSSDDNYVARQKEDIKELAEIFKGKLSSAAAAPDKDFPECFRACFRPQSNTQLKYKINLKGKDVISIRVDNAKLEVGYGDLVYPDVELTMEPAVLNEICSGRKTFQGGFMEGSILSKGDFKSLRMLDSMFPFMP